jgi:hypothetical protein
VVKKGKRFHLFLVMVILTQLSCATMASALDRINCQSKGGQWRQEANSYGDVEEWCEMPSAQTGQQPAATQSGEAGSCFAPQNTFNWSYEDLRSSSGTGGVTCNARFLFKNKSAESLTLIIYTSWDNNKMHASSWDSHQVPAGDEWEKGVSRTIYNSGVITFDRVERLLVVRNVPECVNIVPSMSQAATWEAQAEYLDEIPCP